LKQKNFNKDIQYSCKISYLALVKEELISTSPNNNSAWSIIWNDKI